MLNRSNPHDVVIDENTKVKDLNLITEEQRDTIGRLFDGRKSSVFEAIFTDGIVTGIAMLCVPDDAETGDLTIKDFAANAYRYSDDRLSRRALKDALLESLVGGRHDN